MENATPRETSLGWLHYAASYAISARALATNRVEATHPDAPIQHLYRHALELYLKSFLLHTGIAPTELKQKYGHNTERLVDEAIERGLLVTDEQRAQIVFCNDPIPDRYLKTGTRTELTKETLAALCSHLNSVIGPPIYQASGLSRRPPAL